MGFDRHKEKVEENDTVILYLGFNNMHSIVINKGSTFQTRYGALRHADLIGVRYGSKIQCPRGFLYVLEASAELWTVNLPHRTQILYSTDISMVTLQLDLKPGSVIVESGTGSGSLSHALIRTIAPTGHLYTFEFHEQRAKLACEEFKDHGLGDYVTVTHRDVCQSGFQLDHIADAVFLDLPRPWEVINSAKQAIKHQGGRLCSFSPCIEQVQRTAQMLTDEGFVDVITMECLLRNHDIRTVNLPMADLGPVGQRGATGDTVSQSITDEETLNEDSVGDKTSVKCLKPSRDTSENCTVLSVMGNIDTSTSQPAKTEQTEGASKNTRHDYDLIGQKDGKSFFFKTAAPVSQMPGHTGFLTFATIYSS